MKRLKKETRNKEKKHNRRVKKRGLFRTESAKKRTALLLSVCVLILISISAYYIGKQILLKSTVFCIKEINVINNRFTPVEKICSLSKIERGNNIFSVDLVEVKKRIQSYFIIRDVTIKRHLPDQIIIKVYERFPVSSIFVNNTPFLIDEDGVIIGNNSSFKATALPTIRGCSLTTISIGQKLISPVIDKAIDLVMFCRESSLRDYIVITSIDISNPRNIRLKTADDTLINIGDSDFEERVSRLIAIYKDTSKKDLRNDSIDLRYDSVPVTFKKDKK